MRYVLGSAIAIAVLGSASAMAADMQRPAYKAPMLAPAPVTTWTGCYIGGNVGGLFGNASVSAPGGEVSPDGSGFAAGGQVGCDYQFSGGFVIGIRDQLDWTSNKRSGTIASGALAGTVVNFNNQWFDTLTGRVGYAFQPAWLAYFQGGAAWAHTSTDFSGAAAGQVSNSRTGWTVGGGVEWMFVPHWSAFLEGNYMDFGTISGTVTGVPVNVKANATNVLVGINYRFF
ncbi:MAG TPA: outer membrane beta-barrel protein [Pseudolabrys sp.]|nr:outer membrane beta-barrel protein [Pseudolabrys sp.]